jgi:hypothetical protein
MDILNRHLLEELTELALKYIEFPVFWTKQRLPFIAFFSSRANPASARPLYFILLQLTNEGKVWSKKCSAGTAYVISAAAYTETPDIYDAKTGVRTPLPDVPAGMQHPAIAVRRAAPHGIAQFQFGNYDSF